MTDEQAIKKMQELPIVGQDYPCYDDGKIRESRKHKVMINSIVEFDKRDSYLDDLWQQEIEEWESFEKISHREKPKTDYFILGTLITNDKYKQLHSDVVFARNELNYWFCLLGNGGLLDVTGGYLEKFEDSFFYDTRTNRIKMGEKK